MRDFIRQTRQNYPKSNNFEKAVDNSESYGIIKNNNRFVPAEDVKKSEDYARNVLGIKNVSYKGVDITTANAWNEGLADTFSRFPELKKQINFVGTCQERNKFIEEIYREVYTDGYIKSNPNVPVNELKPYIEESVKKLMKNYNISPTVCAESFFLIYHILYQQMA
ncbi:MAG: hypothetical protein NC177_17785 [Ruminococcus flavefaciens]|nr:hypothetical protein [Ruminococcus flavefaciens]